MPDETQTRTEGPTPNGGAYAIAYWQDMHGNPVDKSEYARFEIVEYDEAGNQVFRTYGVNSSAPQLDLDGVPPLPAKGILNE
jgi:hypothetical protein